MKKLLISGCLGAILAGLTGCEMLSNGMSGSLANVPPQVRRFEVDQKQVFQAVQLALKQMDFVPTRTAQAQGIVEGHSNLRDTAVFGAARQFTARIRLSEVEGGNTEVAILCMSRVKPTSRVASPTVSCASTGFTIPSSNI